MLKVSLKSALFSMASSWIKSDADEDMKFAKQRVADLKGKKTERLDKAKKCVEELIRLCKMKGSPVSNLVCEDMFNISVDQVTDGQVVTKKLRRFDLAIGITFKITKRDWLSWKHLFKELPEGAKNFSRREEGVNYVNVEFSLPGFECITLQKEVVLSDDAPCKVTASTSVYYSLSCPIS